MPRLNTAATDHKQKLKNQRRFKTIPDHQRPGNWYTIHYRMGDNPMPQNMRVEAENLSAAKQFVQTQLPQCILVNP